MAAVATVGLIPGARAAAFFSFAQANVTVYDSSFSYLDGAQNQNGTFANDPTSGSYAWQSLSAPGLSDGVVATLTSAADLQGGALHAFASLTQPTGAGDMGQMVGAYAEAGMGDSFHALNAGGGAFDWSSGVGTFSMSVDGSVSTDATAYVRGWDATLTILKPGSLAAGLAFDSASRLGFQEWIWYANSGFGYISTLTDPMGAISADASGSLASTVSLSASFNVGSDFDWMLTLDAAGGVYAGSTLGGLLSDLSNTLTVAYQGPSGTTTASASGLFPETVAAPAVAAPEPMGAAVMLSALVGLAGLARVSPVRGARNAARCSAGSTG